MRVSRIFGEWDCLGWSPVLQTGFQMSSNLIFSTKAFLLPFLSKFSHKTRNSNFFKLLGYRNKKCVLYMLESHSGRLHSPCKRETDVLVSSNLTSSSNIEVSPSGKAQRFDRCIRWFKSNHLSQSPLSATAEDFLV